MPLLLYLFNLLFQIHDGYTGCVMSLVLCISNCFDITKVIYSLDFNCFRFRMGKWALHRMSVGCLKTEIIHSLGCFVSDSGCLGIGGGGCKDGNVVLNGRQAVNC